MTATPPFSTTSTPSAVRCVPNSDNRHAGRVYSPRNCFMSFLFQVLWPLRLACHCSTLLTSLRPWSRYRTTATTPLNCLSRHLLLPRIRSGQYLCHLFRASVVLTGHQLLPACRLISSFEVVVGIPPVFLPVPPAF
jgi:hypothetical protein